jgi:type I restriction enzyme R subunit
LDTEPTDYLRLRDYQVGAIKAVEGAIQKGQKAILVAAATGTGKTRTAIGLVYRLLKSNRFRRVLFLVDRSSLGVQTEEAFDEVEIENLQTFGQIFGLEGLKVARPAIDTRLHVSTVQGMVRRIFDDGDPKTTPKVDDYDCVIVDECHRGYGLDQEMSDAEVVLSEYGIRSQEDYISKYRRVLEHFDAVKIGLTATPAKHTAAIFGRPVFQYTYREAVIDGHLIDHEPPINITTRLAEEGIHIDRGEQVQLFDPKTVQVDLVDLEDELDFEVSAFNKRVLNENFNRVVCEELAKHIDPGLPEKTLVFAATDMHADQVVGLLKKAFKEQYGEVEDDMVVKITGAADKPLSLIRHYKNERNPKVVVTVDLLTTGIDVPKICNLVFLRRVKSRILYDQMIGRATRQCDEIGKETFKIFDAVGLYESLQDVTEMKPVVKQPNTSFNQLVEELKRVVAEVPQEEAQQNILDQIVAKLQRKKKVLKGQQLEFFRATAQMEPEALAEQLRHQKPQEALEYLTSNETVVKVLDATGPSAGTVLSDSADEVVSVTRGYGQGKKRPEDYLDAFSRFVTENMNALPALQVVAQRPRDLTRKDLKALEIELATKGFTETNLRSAWSEAKNEDIAASVVGFVRQAALGDPLKDYSDRVDQAIKRLSKKHNFTPVQKRWLGRFSKAIKQDAVLDREALDKGQFATDGGFDRFNKVFGGKLEVILGDLRESIWESEAS